MQSDINGKSGFNDMIKVFDDDESKEKGIHCFRFNESDIFRSEILKYIVTEVDENTDFKSFMSPNDLSDISFLESSKIFQSSVFKSITDLDLDFCFFSS